MSLTSFEFLLFLGILFILYYIVPKKLQWVVLLVASLYFYLSASVKLASFLLFTTVTVWIGALIVGDLLKKQRLWLINNKDTLSVEERNKVLNTYARKKRRIIGTVGFLNLGILAFLKYFNFFAGNANCAFAFLEINTSMPLLKFMLPLGISFYTFQAIGYIVDVSRGLCEPQRNFMKFALFTCYFPTVMQGPLNHFGDLSPQLLQPHSFDYTQITFGMQRMLWGFFKKLVIADRLALLVNEVYGNWQSYAGFQFVVATIFFAFQLYTDFSGYMDIAIGASQVFGIKLPENFRTPFFSRSISEYWRRWHITLGLWFKDYLFYPLLKSDFFQRMIDVNQERLGKKTAKAITTYSVMFILWFTIGLWHGASWKFIVGGGLIFWLYIVSGEVCMPLSKRIIVRLKIRTDCFSWKLFQSVRTFCLVCISFLFFRADSFMAALHIAKRTLWNLNPSIFLNGSFLQLGMGKRDFLIVGVGLLALLWVSVLQQKGSVRKKLSMQPLIIRWSVFYSLLFSIMLFGITGNDLIGGFIYAQF